MRRFAGLAVAFLIVSACQTTDAQLATSSSGAQQSEAVDSEQNLEHWLAGVRAEAMRQGVSKRTLDLALRSVKIIPRILELDSSQPEFSRTTWAYLDSAVSENRIRNGRQKLEQYGSILNRVSQEFGAPPEILVAFWGVETDYGIDLGSFNVIDAVATLAFKSRRQAYFRTELLAALQILEKGDIPREKMLGSWAGAMGQTLFMPTIFLKHALDEDGDGRRDIWSSMPDIFASTAHFVVKGNGWKPGRSWGEEVRLPKDFPWDQAEWKRNKSLSEWISLGVRQVRTGAPPAGDPNEPAAIIIPGGYSGPAFLVRENFDAIMRYNPSISYALAVALLSDRLAGREGVVQPWPRHEQALSRSERVELQEILISMGYGSGKADSLIGPVTRNSLRKFQSSIGEVPDGFPTKSLLNRLRQAAQNQ
ncbi:membrane-bound lytic murein transglycosylase B [Azospirillaceae bacterium]